MSNVLKPTYVICGLGEIDPVHFHEKNPGIRAISYDRDGTVTDYHDIQIPPDFLETLRIFTELGIVQGFNSNSDSRRSTERLQQVADAISDAIGKTFYVATSYAAKGRKPGRSTFDQFASITGVPPSQTAHVGDQIYKDVLGANKAGLAVSILVARHGTGDDWRVRYLQRPLLEVPTRVGLGLPLRQTDFPCTLTRPH